MSNNRSYLRPVKNVELNEEERADYRDKLRRHRLSAF